MLYSSVLANFQFPSFGFGNLKLYKVFTGYFLLQFTGTKQLVISENASFAYHPYSFHGRVSRANGRSEIPSITTLSMLDNHLPLTAYMVMDTIRAQRERLKSFLDEMLLVTLGRSERCQWGDLYVRGLLATGGRKVTSEHGRPCVGRQCASDAVVYWPESLALGSPAERADSNVFVLDPYCGTGSYLGEVLKHIYQTLKSKGADALLASDLKQAALTKGIRF